jgi:hypothetical protein
MICGLHRPPFQFLGLRRLGVVRIMQVAMLALISRIVFFLMLLSFVPHAWADDALSCDKPLPTQMVQCWKGTLDASAGWTVLKKPGGSVALQCDDSWTVDITVLADSRRGGKLKGEGFARKASPLICNPKRPLAPMAYIKFSISGSYDRWLHPFFDLVFKHTGEFGPTGGVDHTEFGLMLAKGTLVFPLISKYQAQGNVRLSDVFPSPISRRYGSGEISLECRINCDYVPAKNDCREYYTNTPAVLWLTARTYVVSGPSSPRPGAWFLESGSRVLWDQAQEWDGVVWYHMRGKGGWVNGSNVDCVRGPNTPAPQYGSLPDLTTGAVESASVLGAGARG